MSNGRVELSTISIGDEWEKFIASMPDATIFHHPSWINTISNSYRYKSLGLVMRDNNGEIRAGLPFAFVDSFLTGRRWISYPFSDYCLPLYRSESDQNQFSQSIVEFCKENKFDPFEIRWNMSQNPKIESRVEAVIHFKKLDSDFERISASINRKTRHAVQQSENYGVRVVMGNTRKELELFYRLHLDTRRRKGVPIQPWKFFEQLGKNVLESGNGFVLLAYHADQCIAGAVFCHYSQTLTYKFGASLQDQLNLRPNNLILWKAIQWGCENGFKLFDMGKTDIENTGLRSYKSKWGAEEQELMYSSITSKPISAKAGRLHTILETVIKNSPAWVCRLSGELLYRHFA